MKFWHKTFLATLALFLVAFDLGIFMIADLAYQNTMDSEKMKDLGEHYFITASLAKDIDAIEAREGETDTMLQSLFESYGNYYRKQSVNLEVLRDGETVYSNLPYYGGDRPELVLEADMRNVLLREVDGQDYLYIAGALPAPLQNDTLVYAKNLNFIVDAQRTLTKALLTASVMISIALAAALYFVLRQLSKPIRELSATTRRIAAGKYGERVEVKGKDEFAQLGGSFNDMAEEIEFQMDSLARASRQKQQFIDNLAHELRTPLTTIHGYAEYIQKVALSEDDKFTASEYIMNESTRLKEVAFKLMDMAVLRENGITAVDIDIHALIRSCIATSSVAARRKQASVRAEIEKINFKGDPDLLQSLVVNLIDNAVKACRPGGKVLVKTRYNDEGNAEIVVKDDGKGMTKEQLEHVTQPFYRVDKARSRQEGGAGLGLALCRQIAECHNAELEFASRPGEGTTVTILFYTSITKLLQDQHGGAETAE